MRDTLWKPLLIALPSAAIVLAALFLAYRLVDPLPPRRLAIAAATAGSGYTTGLRGNMHEYWRARGVELEIRNSAGAWRISSLLRDAASGVQAALTTLGVTQPHDADTSIHSVGYSMQRSSSFTGTPSPLRNLRNSEASAFPSASRERPRFARPGDSERPLRHWMLPRVSGSGSHRSNRCLDRGRNRCGDVSKSAG